MAETRLADLVIPEVFVPGILRESIEKSALFNVGLVAVDAALTSFVQANFGQKLQIPYLLDIDDAESNISSDDPGVDAVPRKITSAQEDALKSMRNQSWSTMDLTAAITSNEDPAGAIQRRIGAYWARQMDRHTLSLVNGLVASNIANNAGDMVHNIGNDNALPALATELVSASAIIDARHTSGDRWDEFEIVACHSVVFANLQKQQLIDFVRGEGPAGGANIQIPFFHGMRVHVSDQCATTVGANRTIYNTYLFRSGALRYGQGTPRIPLEIERKALSGNGEGQEFLVSRNHFCVHPAGFSWLGAAMAGQSPTWVELSDATNWDRVVERKRVPIAVLQSNG
ncbi:MAG: major capsid protein [Gammaproteobacteria bacterium]